jgi:sulfatase maturation enzyme AslB (radical SAM superfamily)
MNNVICSLPFNSVSIDPSGKLRQCCNSDAGVFSESVQTINTNGLINNKSIQKLRSSLLQGTKEPMCGRCWKMEDIGNKSFRQIANEDHDHGLASIEPNSFKEIVDYLDIRYLDITLGNKCNLACRMCHPGSSSLIAKQYIDLGYQLYAPPVLEFDRDGKDKILQLITNAVNLTSIYLLGGEPLINEFHDEIIELLIKLNRAKNITLHYSTNLHTDVEKHLERWSNFKLVEISVSIDGSEEIYEYIRWPGSWKKVYGNLKKVYDIAQYDNRIVPGVAITAQNLNVGNIPSLMNAIQDIGSLLSYYFIPVTGCNNIEYTPIYILEDAIEKLSKLSDPYNRINELSNYYKKAVTVKSSVTANDIEKFFNKQRDYDGLRKQNLFQTIPYFLDLAKEYNIKTW